MKGCLRSTGCLLHQRRDRGGNTHNFPFDTLTKVYRDTMYATQERYRGNPMYPERGPHGSSAATTATASASPTSNVTNHVGNIGVMSAAATPLSEWMEELLHHGDGGRSDHDHRDDHNEHERGHIDAAARGSPSARTKHTKIVRGSPTPTAVAAAGAPGMDDEAVRARLRAHMFADKKDGNTGRGLRAASDRAAVALRHSGVQIEILNMYRSMLREVRRMEDADTRRNLAAYIRSEFDKHRDVPRKNILKIEWQLNYGKRKLEDLQAMDLHTKFTVMR